jgi:shikimate kinase
VAEVFAAEGEGGFRRREAAALRGCAAHPEVVVATGGGIVGAEANRQWMREHGLVVWLNADFPVLASRLGGDARRARPLFADPDQAERLWRRRLPAYRDCDLEVAVGAADSAGEIARRLAARLEERACAT